MQKSKFLLALIVILAFNIFTAYITKAQVIKAANGYIEIIYLPDGTKCVIWQRYLKNQGAGAGGIDCDWEKDDG